MAYETLELWGCGGPSTHPIVPANTLCKPRTIYSPESRALQQCKNEINNFYQEGKWDDYKKITNPYEYIFLSWNRRSSRSVTTRQPLSRSYFKMIELWKRLHLTEYLATLVKNTGGLVTAHAAEGPGGFIEACTVMSEKNGWKFKSAIAITLRSEAKNVPGWRKAARFLTNYPQVSIHDGLDGTGNILFKENQDAFVHDVRTKHPNGVHLFSADGGFDFSSDYNAQEDSIFPLLIAETLLGLRVLAKGGCLIIKCFDTTEQPTLDLIWLISRAFCEWGVVKPRTSRAGNAERYIIDS
jgi:23S rRNA U2552 (ribose-2'-O)-methylase RlmE/FtsJ